jgi:DNA-directed RNA polymerase specialized sigma24 family protein
LAYDALAARLGMPLGSIGPTRARCFRKLEASLRTMGIDGDA